MANEKWLIDANALCEFFQERYEYLRNASETPLPGGLVRVDALIQGGAIIAKEFLDKVKAVPTVDAVEVVHGKWIKGKYPGEYTCSRCGMEYCEADPTAKPYKYCPECGSKNE